MESFLYPTNEKFSEKFPRIQGNKLTQKDNTDSGVQFITPAGKVSS